MNTSFALSLMGRFAKPRCTGSFRGTSYHGRKTIFSFSGRPEKMVFPKKFALEYDILCIVGKVDISVFSKIWSYLLEGKWKMNFLKKAHENIIFSSGVWKRWSFPKDHARTWAFLYCLERWCLFLWKHNIFSLDRKWKMIFLKKYTEARYFLRTCRR